jgi:hypothetical protein
MSGKTSDKAMMAILTFMLGAGACGLEVYLLFKDKWMAMDGDFMDKLMSENVFFIILVTGFALAPCFALMLYVGNKSGKRVGEEAEHIARGLNP